MSRTESRRYFVFLVLLSFAAAAPAGPPMLFMVLLWNISLYLYSAKLKSRFLLGNLAVSLVCSSGFVAGAWITLRSMARA